MKTKKQRSNFNSYNEIFLLSCVGIFIINLIIFLVLFFSIVKTNYEAEKIYSDNYFTNTKSVEISTDKSIYSASEKINLTVKNNGNQSIYFEPCEYLNNFEKKIDGEWERENNMKGDKTYNEAAFRKNKKITECEVKLPKSGEGTYRIVTQIYYNCQKPGDNMCESSKTFYSNEFEIKGVVKGCGC